MREFSRYDAAIWRAFCAASHNSIRRNSELTRCDIDGVRYGMLLWSSGGSVPAHDHTETWVALFFDKSKMNHTGRPQVALMSCRCPKVCALHELIYVAHHAHSTEPSDQIFRFHNGKVINYKRSLRWIKRMCAATGMDPTMFATQGFRSGGCVDHLDEGYDEPLIMQQAGWRSRKSLKCYADKRTARQLLKTAVKGYGLASPLGHICLPTWKADAPPCQPDAPSPHSIMVAAANHVKRKNKADKRKTKAMNRRRRRAPYSCLTFL